MNVGKIATTNGTSGDAIDCGECIMHECYTDNNFEYHACAHADFSPERQQIAVIVGVCTIIFACIRLFMETCQLINFDTLVQNCRKTHRNRRRMSIRICLQRFINWKYLKQKKIYLEILVYILSIGFSLSCCNKCLCTTYRGWQIGILAILFAWVNLLHFFNKWPLIGKYIAMFQTIIVRFLKVLIIAVVLLVAFSLAFYMALHEPDLPVSYE